MLKISTLDSGTFFSVLPTNPNNPDTKNTASFKNYIDSLKESTAASQISALKPTIFSPVFPYLPYTAPQPFSTTFMDMNDFQFLSDKNISPEEHASFINYIRNSIDYSKDDDPFTSEDIRLFHVVSLENTSIYFPPPTAPMATKKAWASAMKQLSDSDRIKAKLLILRTALQYASKNSDMSLKDRVVQYISHITSYQPFFQQIISDLEIERKNVPQKYSSRFLNNLVRINQRIIATFNKYQVSQV